MNVPPKWRPRDVFEGMTPNDAPLVDAFHTHLETCDRCANRPFDLCPRGARLLKDVAEDSAG